MTGDERRATLEAIATEVRGCTRCRLHENRTHAVPGEGSPETEVVMVGEGPGQNEDEQGRPFVGAAGGLLTELIRSIGWRREDVFITNVVKCRPPNNRDPEPDEIAACAPYLRRQLAVLDPAVVVTLGRFSLGTFMPGARISQAHGTSRPVDPATGAPDAQAYALYHPAAAFRQAQLRDTLFGDMAALPELLLRSRAARAARRDEASGSQAAEASAAATERGAAAEASAPGVPVMPTEAEGDPAQEPDAGLLEAVLALGGASAAALEPNEDPDQMQLF